MTIHRQLIKRNLRSYRPLHNLPLTLSHCRAKLQWFSTLSGWNYADWGRIVFSNESHFQLCPDNHRSSVRRRLLAASLSCFHFGRHWRPTYSTAACRRHSENCFATVPFAVPWPYFQQDNVRPHTLCVIMNCVLQLVKHFLEQPDRQISLQSSMSRI
ncbi:hypothetical protein TNCV_1366971 [Trichonephila clavipes]|nr:hypothetical protein TNCV_1366971 [Trichonephila clavipes]